MVVLQILKVIVVGWGTRTAHEFRDGEIDAMFVLTRFRPLVEYFYLALKGVQLRVIPTPQVASLFIYLSPQHEEALEPLNQAFRQVILAQQVKEHNLDPFNCPDA